MSHLSLSLLLKVELCCGHVKVFLFFRFDVYRKVPKDLTEPTLTGAVSKWCIVLDAKKIVCLTCSKF